MRLRTSLLFLSLGVLILLFFVLDVAWGSVSIPLDAVIDALLGRSEETTYSYLILHFRLPKAVTSLFAGAGIAVAGLQMQSLFRNPLADTSILGINSGAGVGVAVYTMASVLFPGLSSLALGANTWGIIIASCLGSLMILLVISVVATRVRDMISVLIIGVMVGFLASSVISILQFFSSQEMLKTYLIWSFGSVSTTTWRQLTFMLPIVSLALLGSLLMPKQMNALLLGESYARSLGVDLVAVRYLLITITSVLTGCITAFTGPIAFLGLAVPYLVRLIFRTSDHRVLLPATMLMGGLLLLVCDLLTQAPGYQFVLPINALTSLLGAPVVILVVLGSRSGRKTFH